MFCSECGAKNEPGTRFCAECGNKLEKAAPAQTGQPQQQTAVTQQAIPTQQAAQNQNQQAPKQENLTPTGKTSAQQTRSKVQMAKNLRIAAMVLGVLSILGIAIGIFMMSGLMNKSGNSNATFVSVPTDSTVAAQP